MIKEFLLQVNILEGKENQAKAHFRKKMFHAMFHEYRWNFYKYYCFLLTYLSFFWYDGYIKNLFQEGMYNLGKIVAIANQKGGVGKTTTAVNLSTCLAKAGKKVLMIDADPQGNATSGLGIEKEVEFSVYDVMINDVSMDKATKESCVKNLKVCPSNINLAGAEVELVSMMSREYRLKEKTDEIKDKYDYIIIDCPPSLGLITLNAFTSADSVLIPIQCEYYALEGLRTID